jgi:ABC-2 type transport system ATP-binding protein
LKKLEDRLVATMSKGMKQRLQLARILLHDPKILVLDEPASDLDPRARIEIRDLLLELRSLGKTIFLSSHILTELADVCTSVAILERGRLVVSGPIHEIAERMAQRQAAMAVGHEDPHGPPTKRGPQDGPDLAGRAAAAAIPGYAPAYTVGGAPIPAQVKRRVKLRVMGASRGLIPLLEKGPGILAVDVGPGGQAMVTYQGDDRLLAEMVRHLVSQGVPLIGVEPERSELERIFLEATQGDLQ